MNKAKKTKRTNETNRFQCSKCRRALGRKGKKSFKCSMCGHGTMEMVKPRAYCKECEDPIYDNITPQGERVPFFEGRDYVDVFCSKCTCERVEEIVGLEKKLHTKFIDTDDYNEKMALYRTKVREVEEADADVSKIRVKTLGGRLRVLRKKLDLTLVELAGFFKVQSKSTVLQYEKDTRKIPNNIKDWLKTAESTFRHLGRDMGKKKAMENLLNIEGL